MKTLGQHIQEKLIINKDYHDNIVSPKSVDELRKIIEDRYDKLGPGTEQDPIDFNDIDVSIFDSLRNDKNIGIFDGTLFKYIDISDWNVSNMTSMRCMFFMCKELKSVGDISNWDVSNVTNMSYMFAECKELESSGDLSSWDVSSVTDMSYMFYDCENFNQDLSGWDVSSVKNMTYMFAYCENFNQDLSNWDVSSVTNMRAMFKNCSSFNQDLSNWDVSNVINGLMFYNCPIKEEYKPKFK